MEKKPVASVSYLSQSLTFLQLLVQQPADIKAATKRERGGEEEEETSSQCVHLTRGGHLIKSTLWSMHLSVYPART